MGHKPADLRHETWDEWEVRRPANVSVRHNQNLTSLETCTEDVEKPVFFFACALFCEFREPGKFAKITGSENLNTVAFQCSMKQKRQNYGVQNNYIDSNAKIKSGRN